MADPDAATAKMIANLEAATGRPLAQWVADARASGHAKHGQIVAWLKSDQGLGNGYANLVAHKTLASDAGSHAGEDLLTAMFEGPKAAMKPAYDKAAAFVASLGDVEFAPKKGYVSLRRNKQFALLQPSTKDRLDVGITLKGVEPEGRLEKAGSWNAMVTHRVSVGSAEEVDAELQAWLRRAWEAG
ncbi:MAG: DUF4287 domain-containing protein [Alphaproteobacteria bacterium]|nr:DUF4287 domain-containing protein [Alphaproteobacteria bacterium]MBU1524790.1 DUF4287 domain-containing protein [Alphaproteobacteria bacterium]MBU2116662.1 DUF4287 domain-containing protein [Alphaproteobacteria bacterium]MBU2349910.1 DUF4287 domain-containing protein [Alphaproteobacteria bacterium]MBU2383653.1 DUF4287 domain-containing protein [Alphaproteobacteria bacterium]